MAPLYRLWAIFLIAYCLFLAWIGQSVVFLAPQKAADWGLSEHESEVDPGLWADVRGEAFCDMCLIWMLGVAGILLWYSHPFWPYFGLIGGGMYVYFGVRGICQRVSVLKRGVTFGPPSYIYSAMGFCTGWCVTALITIALAVRELERRSRGQRGQYETISSHIVAQ